VGIVIVIDVTGGSRTEMHGVVLGLLLGGLGWLRGFGLIGLGLLMDSGSCGNGINAHDSLIGN
jgi:hypothetical protein